MKTNSQQKRKGHKMWYTNIYSNTILNKKYIGTSIEVGCATRNVYTSSRPKVDGVPTDNKKRRGSGPCASEEF